MGFYSSCGSLVFIQKFSALPNVCIYNDLLPIHFVQTSKSFALSILSPLPTIVIIHYQNLSATMKLESSGLPVRMPGSLLISRWKDKKPQSSGFETLPGEIRNQIFEYYIQTALRPTKPASRSTKSPSRCLELSILPRWHGPVRVCMHGIDPLPLMFVNKRTLHELASVVYSRVEVLRIGGYILQSPKDDPTLRWNLIHPLLRNPYISRLMRSVKITLPTIRDDIHRKYCDIRGFHNTGFRDENMSSDFQPVLSVIPGLVECLENFLVLSSLEISITAESVRPPDFDPILPLYDLCGPRTTVVFVDHLKPLGWLYRNVRSPWSERWDIAWQSCLIRNGRQSETNFG